MRKMVKVGKNAFKDMLKFKKLGKTRDSIIESNSAEFIPYNDPISEKADHLHPNLIKVKITDIIPRYDAKEFVLSSLDNSPLPFFRAGSYLSIKTKIGESYTSRPYSICSSPKLALEGKYSVMVEDYPAGFVAPYIYKNLKIGDEINISSPMGTFYYEPLRDKHHIIALAGGSGVTPFISMAYAIRDRLEDFDLTLIYGSRTIDSIYFKEELDEVMKETDKVKVIHVLSDEKIDGFEYGFITSDLIKKYAPLHDYSVFACGPGSFYAFMKEDIKKLQLPNRQIRFEMEAVGRDFSFDPKYPLESKNRIYKGIIKQGGKEYKIDIRGDEPILCSIERAGIKAQSSCRSGVCGWCRTRVVEGKTYNPEKNENRRKGDILLGFIHPCASFALSDLVLEIAENY